MKFSKLDFVAGHMDFMKKNFQFKTRRIVGKNVDIDLVDKVIERKPIVYVDSYCLFEEIHMPHFVTALGKQGSDYVIYDPWDGKKKTIARAKLSKGIKLLKNHIKLKPQIIV